MLRLRTIRVFFKRIAVVCLAYTAAVYAITALIPPPDAVAIKTDPRSAYDVKFLADESWVDQTSNRVLQQSIFDEVFSLIDEAQQFLLIDMFLFNDWQGPIKESHRGLSGELTEALIKRKRDVPELQVVFITDPVNSIYRGLESNHLTALRNAGIVVVETDLTQLQDSNPLYSGLWRTLIKPFGNTKAETIKNPIGDGKVSMRSLLAMVNFKANHRKLAIAGRRDGSARAIVLSANPHDGSSAHRNVAMSFTGDAIIDLLNSEIALLELSASFNDQQPINRAIKKLRIHKQALESQQVASNTDDKIQVLTESRIRNQVVQTLDSAGEGAAIDLLMFYLSDRRIVTALKKASQRGAKVRVLLDVNKDAFGREKNGVPNRPVAAELVEAGVEVKWCATQGEQCHGKMLLWSGLGDAMQDGVLLGSGNYTRRNLGDFNLETNVLFTTKTAHSQLTKAQQHFERQWQDNTPGRQYSHDYEEYADDSLSLKVQYRLMEALGVGTF